MAMSVDGHYHFYRILPRHWEAETRRSGYDPARAGTRTDILAQLPEEASALFAICIQEGAATPEFKRLLDLMLERVTNLKGACGAEEMQPESDRIPGLWVHARGWQRSACWMRPLVYARGIGEFGEMA